jgi:hypothetical protein
MMFEPAREGGGRLQLSTTPWDGGQRLVVNRNLDGEELLWGSRIPPKTTLLRADDAWHEVVLEAVQRSSTHGDVRVTLDGTEIIDVANVRLCSPACAPLQVVKAGLYQNDGVARDQDYWLDDVLIADIRDEVSAAPPGNGRTARPGGR